MVGQDLGLHYHWCVVLQELSQLWQDKVSNHKSAAPTSPSSQGALLAPPQDG